MKDDMFWCVYFLLVYSKTGDVLLAHNPADENSSANSEQQHDKKGPETPIKQTRSPPHTPADVEGYFDKLYATQMAEHSDLVDDGVEPDEDNYFSPLKYKYNSAISDEVTVDNATNASTAIIVNDT